MRCKLALALVALAAVAACSRVPSTPTQPPGTRLSLGKVSAFGIFDPSLADTGAAPSAWLSYSAVDPSRTHPEMNARAISTRLAYSTDHGATWTDSGVAINEAQDVALKGSHTGTWINEVSSLAFDPSAPPAERWKIFWHRYLQVDGVSKFQDGWIAYKAAADPIALRDARELKLFAGIGYDSVNDTQGGKTMSPVAGPPKVFVQTLDKEIKLCVAVSEPGALATPAGVYVAMTCVRPRIGNVFGLGSMDITGTMNDVILLRCEAPCDPERAGAWRYVSTMLREDDARAVTAKEYSAPDLFVDDGVAYLIATPTSNIPFGNAYHGCNVMRLSSLETGDVVRFDGKPQIVGRVEGPQGTFNGACTYQPFAANGFFYSQLIIAGEHPTFAIYQTASPVASAAVRK